MSAILVHLCFSRFFRHIERLPDVDDPQRAVEEKIAQNVTAVSYLGL